MKNKKVLIVSARYYDELSDSLELSATSSLAKIKYKIIKVPGVFEIPVTISKTPGTFFKWFRGSSTEKPFHFFKQSIAFFFIVIDISE